MNPDLKCYYVKQIALYAQRILYGYKCEMEPLYDDLQAAKRFYYIEQNLVNCALKGSILNDLNKYRKSIQTTYSSSCRGC